MFTSSAARAPSTVDLHHPAGTGGGARAGAARSAGRELGAPLRPGRGSRPRLGPGARRRAAGPFTDPGKVGGRQVFATRGCVLSPRQPAERCAMRFDGRAGVRSGSAHRPACSAAPVWPAPARPDRAAGGRNETKKARLPPAEDVAGAPQPRSASAAGSRPGRRRRSPPAAPRLGEPSAGRWARRGPRPIRPGAGGAAPDRTAGARSPSSCPARPISIDDRGRDEHADPAGGGFRDASRSSAPRWPQHRVLQRREVPRAWRRAGDRPRDACSSIRGKTRYARPPPEILAQLWR